MLTLTTEKETSHGWNAVASRCDVAVSAASLSNSSSHATATIVGAGAEAPSSTPAGAGAAPAAGSASFRVWFLGGRWARRSELSGDILGPFQLTSTNTFASASGGPSGERGAGGGGSPSARRTTSRTRKFRVGGGRGHRIILATIAGGQRTRCLLRLKKKKERPSGRKPPGNHTYPTTSNTERSCYPPNCNQESQLGSKNARRRLDLLARIGRGDPRIGGGGRRKAGFWRRNRD